MKWLSELNNTEILWLGVGFIGQLLFSMRFIIQWIMSERRRRSVVPVAFWYFSLAGGAALFSYALYRRDPVFIAGQGTGLFIYLRNLHLILNAKKYANKEISETKIDADSKNTLSSTPLPTEN
ncbi:MAG: lipid-A-disaccharide synthase N-terminal domain-containing protein [Pseudomonadota bacterium]